ncbi:MAG: hypothetical protein U0W65_13390 [Bacteroidia bacterium]
MFILIGNITCYSQQQDKDIEAVKSNIIGSWKQVDTLNGMKFKYRFTEKKVTYYLYCQDKIILKRTFKYAIKKEFIEELNKHIIIMVLPPKAKKLASHDCNFCEEKTLNHLSFYDWMDIVIIGNKLTSSIDISKKDRYNTLIKE